jgi:uncharacterized protein (TIGR03437 family)
MPPGCIRLQTIFLSLGLCAGAMAANFGTVLPVRGSIADIALDGRRQQLYAANFSAARIEVLSTADRTFRTPLPVVRPPSSLAMSPGDRYLVVGHYDTFAASPSPGAVTIFDFDGGLRQEVALGAPVLATAFGNSPAALVVTSNEFLLLDPVTAQTTRLGVTALPTVKLPVPFATFPQSIVKAATTVSGDGNTILILADLGTNQVALLQYRVGASTVEVAAFTASPPLGPRVISTNQNATSVMAGWALLDHRGLQRAQLPQVLGELRAGSHAYDYRRDVIYANVPFTATEAPVLHLMDTDNLTVRERIRLPQMLAGRSLISQDGETMYSIAEAGIYVGNIGNLARAPRVVAGQEDILFQGDACNRGIISQFLELADPSGNRVDFTLSLPQGTTGVRLSATTGTTPARIRIDVDPAVFQNNRGTAAIPLAVNSAGAVNIAPAVRLLVNTRDVNQRGRIVNIAGKLTDMLADRVRNRLYIVRQDKNLVLVFDTVLLRQVGELRTGNTPMGLAITEDNRHLIVGNDNSQYASVFDLETLQAAEPIEFPGVYPRMFGVARNAIWATVRPVATAPQTPPANGGGTPPPAEEGAGNATLYRVIFGARVANPPPSLGIFNNRVPDTAVLVETPNLVNLLLALPDGSVALYEASAERWVVSRKDLPGAGGAYGALTDDTFLLGNSILDYSLYPVAKLDSTPGTSSGVALLGASPVRTSAGPASGPGTLERIDLDSLRPQRGALTIEAPATAATMTAVAPPSQTGQAVIPFTRTLAVPANGSAIFSLGASGLFVVTPDYDAPTVAPAVSRVTNTADGTTAVAPGGLIRIIGAGLAPTTASAPGIPLPTALGDACLTVGGQALALFRVSPTEVQAQLPFNVSGPSPLVVRNPGGISTAFPVPITGTAPAIFRNISVGGESGLPAVIRNLNKEVANFTNPLHPDETISIFLTGMGQTTPAVALGAAAPADPLALASAQPQVTIGGVTLEILYAGLVPGQIGIYQIDAYIPRGVRDAVETPLTVTQGGLATTVTVRVVTP